MTPAPIPADEEERLAALAELNLLDTEAEPVFNRITAKLARVFEVPVALISLVARDRQFFKSQTGLPEDLAKARQTARHVVCSRRRSIFTQRSSFAEKKLTEREKTSPLDFMSDPRNVAHAKKVTQEKKREGTEARPEEAPTVQPGKKPRAAKKKTAPAESSAVPDQTAARGSAVPSEIPTPPPPGALEGSLTVLAQRKEIEFHSRANLERLAGLMLTVEDELKQKGLRLRRGGLFRAGRLPNEAHDAPRGLQSRVQPDAGRERVGAAVAPWAEARRGGGMLGGVDAADREYAAKSSGVK